MADMGLRPRMVVKEVMSSPVLTLDEDATVHEAAQLMTDSHIGCVLITGKEGKPVGIITESDLVTRVLSKNIKPSKLTVKEVMTSPLITIDPDEPLSEAARRMSQLNLRRLGVMYKGNLVGLISSKDVLNVTPELIEIIQEEARIARLSETEEVIEPTPSTGYCDKCGEWSDNLVEIEGDFLCEECHSELKNEY